MPKVVEDNDDDVPERHVRRPIINFNPKVVVDSKKAKRSDDDDEGDDEPPKKVVKKVEFEEVEIGGRKYRVEKGAGDAIRKSSKPKSDGTAEIRAMFEDFTKQFGQSSKTNKKSSKKDDDDGDEDEFDDTRLFTDPKGFFKDFKKSLSKELLEQISGLYTTDQSSRSFWSGFYSDNDDLKDYDFIVKAVLNENAKELGAMQTKEGGDKLAELSRDRLLSIAKKVAKSNGKTKVHIEGSMGNRSQVDNDDEEIDDDEVDKKKGMPMTMSSLLKMRREKRRKASIHEEAEE